ncbi:MAG: hydroxyethylthiazole kinase-like uncharacterized protein yjeF, partial [Bacteroidia bacterium]
LLPDNKQYVKSFTIVPIGLDTEFIKTQNSDYSYVDATFIQSIYKPRPKFGHKGQFGHALIIAGSKGKIGAAILATKSCLRSGVGLVTAHVPQVGYPILQSTVPEAMVTTTGSEDSLAGQFENTHYTIGIGPGIGTHDETALFLKNLIHHEQNPMVIDADALNILSKNKAWIRSIPNDSILTPHPKELERLIGEWKNDEDKLDRVKLFCKNNMCYVVIKGAHTTIVAPDNSIYFNSTGNPGMATGGSGDVLTGLITGLLAQAYTSLEACLMGVYLHGLAGDLAASKIGVDALIASDITKHIGSAFKMIHSND